MYRALSLSKKTVFVSRNGVIKVIRRRLATDSEASLTTKKKRSVVRTLFWATTSLTGTFYVGSAFASFYSQPYYDFFSDKVPLGQSMLEYAEAHNWDTLTVADVVQRSKNAAIAVQRFVSDKINGTEPEKPRERPKPVETKVKMIRKEVQPKPQSGTPLTAEGSTGKPSTPGKQEEKDAGHDLKELIRKAEDALAGGTVGSTSGSTMTPVAPETSTPTGDKHVYDVPLPVGFEPPPGFARPAPKKETSKSHESSPASIALISPAISSISASEPIIAHLAGTIDSLASFLDANPKAASQSSDILEAAKNDLTALVGRIEKVKEDERSQLEAKLDEQTHEYTQKLLELEMEAQDRLDNQEEDFRKFFDQERAKLIRSYRAKLDYELQTQTDLINERLQEEVIAQGIELQRRWIREIKVRVEQERGGRLGKLEELSSQLKRLERVALGNSAYLDENIRIHALWSAVRAVTSSALGSPVRKPFRNELRTLRHVTEAREDPVVVAALESLESSDVPDIGVEPFADLASWFASDVAPKVAHVALVPNQDAGVLSYLASYMFSSLQFRRHGLVDGNDVLSVIARAEHHLNEKDLDSAARELNQLGGAAKDLLHDWLQAARRRLEVEQALDVIQTQATLASLLVV